jgi:hypothetical protein
MTIHNPPNMDSMLKADGVHVTWKGKLAFAEYLSKAFVPPKLQPGRNVNPSAPQVFSPPQISPQVPSADSHDKLPRRSSASPPSAGESFRPYPPANGYSGVTPRMYDQNGQVPYRQGAGYCDQYPPLTSFPRQEPMLPRSADPNEAITGFLNKLGNMMTAITKNTSQYY